MIGADPATCGPMGQGSLPLKNKKILHACAQMCHVLNSYPDPATHPAPLSLFLKSWSCF